MKQTLLLFFVLISGMVIGQKHNDDAAAFDIEKSVISRLYEAPQEGMQNQGKGVAISLNDPHGKEITFLCYENTTMSEEMKKAYPTLRTFTGYDLVNKNNIATITSFEGILQAFIHPHHGTTIEINYDQDAQKYTSSFHKNEEEHQCTLDESREIIEQRNQQSSDRSLMPQNGSVLKTFKMGIVVTDSFIKYYGGGNSVNAIAAATAVMNNINAVYKNTLAVSFVLNIVPDGSHLYTSAGVSLNIAGSAVNSYFPAAGAYDIGHVFHYISGGGGGIANLGVVCKNSIHTSPQTFPGKAGGISSGTNATLLYDIAVHEIGHQLGAGHTLSGTQGNCAGFSFDNTAAVEPGSGTTIMSYSNICGSDNITNQAGIVDPGDNTYFHAWSIHQMLNYINTQSCYATMGTNNPPTASANPCGVTTFEIPKSTPFELIGSATDSDNDNLSYQWDQVNIVSTAATIGGYCGNTIGPIFRSYPPTSSPKRTFPSLEYILNNANSPIASVGECLPSVARALNFKFIARDNNVNAGGIDIKDLTVTVTNTGPLTVTSPNTSTTTYAAGSTQTVTWSVNNTNTISDSVNILLSVDGGTTWPYTLAATPNDGSQGITIPNNIPGGNKARIRVESRKYTCFKFFDVSDFNFTITSPCVAITTTISPATNLTTTQGNSALNLGIQNNLGTPLTVAFTGSLTTSDAPGNLIFLNGGTCNGPSNPTYYDLLPFSVNTSGSYTISHGGSGSWVINLYANQFSGANCSNHISSNAIFNNSTGFVNLSSSLTASLTANTIYYLMISGFSGIPSNPNYSVTFTKPSGAIVYQGGLPPVANYSYSYIAVNKATNIITQQSTVSNFTSLSSGSYDIYGVHYYSGTGSNPPTVDPASWVNQNFNTVKNSPTCIAISSNSRQVTVQECIYTVISQAAIGTGTLANILSTIQPGCKVNFAMGIDTISLSSGLDLASNVSIDGTGQNVLINLFNSSATYVFKNTSSGITTLKNIKIKHLNPQSSSNVVVNEGNLTLDTVTVTGNVNQVITNSTSTAKVIIKGSVAIRKT